MTVPCALVYGLAVTGVSSVRALQRRGYDVIAADDDVTGEREAQASELGVELLRRPDAARLATIVGGCELLCPAPGVPESHRVIAVATAAGVDIVSEIELAYRWEQQRAGGPRPVLAVTGTDGKTTTTLMAVEMLRAAGLSTVAAGNTDTPLVDAIEADHDAFVVECTSFRLAWTPTFRANAATWLNLAPDHLNWHTDLASYEAAKAQVWANQIETDVAIGFADDEAVMRHLRAAPGLQRTFATAGADYCLDGDDLVGPTGPIMAKSAMRRSLPHDVTNALAAAALVLESRLAEHAHVAGALSSFVGPPHRLEHVGRWDDIDWFNDSKATTPHAAATAIHAFCDIVLIAGGKDKGVDLAEMATEPERLRAVIAIGETRDAVAAAFGGVVAAGGTVETTERLDDAVDRAAAIAKPGSTVLLSPGCASLDQYTSFEVRGDEFRRLAEGLHRSNPIARSTPT